MRFLIFCTAGVSLAVEPVMPTGIPHYSKWARSPQLIFVPATHLGPLVHKEQASQPPDPAIKYVNRSKSLTKTPEQLRALGRSLKGDGWDHSYLDKALDYRVKFVFSPDNKTALLDSKDAPEDSSLESLLPAASAKIGGKAGDFVVIHPKEDAKVSSLPVGAIVRCGPTPRVIIRRTSDGKKFPMDDVKNDDPIKRVKEKAAPEVGIPADKLDLSGHPDNKTLAQLNIPRGAVLDASNKAPVKRHAAGLDTVEINAILPNDKETQVMVGKDQKPEAIIFALAARKQLDGPNPDRNFSVGPEDVFSPPYPAKTINELGIKPGSTVRVKRAFTVVLERDGTVMLIPVMPGSIAAELRASVVKARMDDTFGDMGTLSSLKDLQQKVLPLSPFSEITELDNVPHDTIVVIQDASRGALMVTETFGAANIVDLVKSEGFASGRNKNLLNLLGDMVKPDCDFEALGPEECAASEQYIDALRQYDSNKAWILLLLFVILYFLGAIMQFLVNRITRGVEASEDFIAIEMLRMVFRQLAIIGLVLAIIEVALHFDFVGVWFVHLLMTGVEIARGDSSYATSEINDIVMDVMLMCTYFLVCYTGLVLCVTIGVFIARRRLESVDTHSAEALTLHEHSWKAQFAARRVMFCRSIHDIAVDGLDPQGFWYSKYSFASMVTAGMEVVRLNRVGLILCGLALLCFAPFRTIRQGTQVIVVLSLHCVPLIFMILLAIRLFFLRRQLLPHSVKEYVAYHNDDETFSRQNPALEPKYMSSPQAHSFLPKKLQPLIRGTCWPNKQESLLWFGRRSRGISARWVQWNSLVHTSTLAYVVFLCETSPELWRRQYKPWPILITALISGLYFVLVPYILWLQGHIYYEQMLIDDLLLSQVWQENRNMTIRRFATLVDALKTRSTLSQVKKGGEELLNSMQLEYDRAPQEVQAQIDGFWDRMHLGDDGVMHLPSLFRLLTRLGINVEKEEDVQTWFDTFSVDGQSIDRRGFNALQFVVKTLLKSNVDPDAVTESLQEDHPDLNSEVTPTTLRTIILPAVRLKWKRFHCQHLFDYMTGEPGVQRLSVAEFVAGLEKIEEKTLGTLTKAVRELQT
ncbi:MAG: hypothetical protein KVP17_002320 [Porospora cf. gigantea B]|uniref:uncharacterized protein n=1 Tax=Porospora cf. gigantea B TaxID=2853592 RepID=UPI003571F580|nr:MAG: hypothetical protein KVP17_002320 [Porospora cf. gigantea B]